MRYRLGENCNNNIDIGPEFLEISDWTRTNGNGSRGRLLRGGRGRQRTVAAFSARLHEDDNDGTSCGTRGFVAPLPRRERERERKGEGERVSFDGGASISPSHRNGCHDRKVSQPPFNRNLDEG